MMSRLRESAQLSNHFAMAREYARQGNCCGTLVCGLFAYTVLALSLFVTAVFAADQLLYIYISFYLLTTRDLKQQVCGVELRHTQVHTYLLFILASPLTICFFLLAVVQAQFKGTPYEKHEAWTICLYLALFLGYTLALVPGLFIFNKDMCEEMKRTQVYQLALLKFRFTIVGLCFFLCVSLFALLVSLFL
jgi:4-amino-4-deoxy-L-arabinose transferase-like glycosyltransferase